MYNNNNIVRAEIEKLALSFEHRVKTERDISP